MRLFVDPKRAAIDMVAENGVGAEIGVHLGEFSSVILSLAKPRKLHLIDPWQHVADPTYKWALYGGENVTQADMDARYQLVLNRFAGEIAAGAVEVHRQRSVDAAPLINDGELDFIYLDGDHTYEAVSQDLKAFFPKIRTGGLIIGDDYHLRGWWKDDVVRAFNEFIAQSRSLVEFKLAGQIVVRKLA